MKMLRDIGKVFFIAILGIGCERTIPDGHYHVEFGNEQGVFQAWEVKEGRMRIAPNPEDSLTVISTITIAGNELTVNPWVDMEWKAEIVEEKDGVFHLSVGVQELKLVPHAHCETNKAYLDRQISSKLESFHYITTNDYWPWLYLLPQQSTNELILGIKDERASSLFNGELTALGNIPVAQTNQEELWVYTDERLQLNEVMSPLLKLDSLGYRVSIATLENQENHEQVVLTPFSISSIEQTEKETIVSTQEFPTIDINQDTTIDFNVSMLKPNRYLLESDTVDLFELKNSLVRWISSSRSHRLNGQVHLFFADNTLFKDYLVLMNKLRWACFESANVIYYKDVDDPDYDRIINAQEKGDSELIEQEFQLNLKHHFKTVQ